MSKSLGSGAFETSLEEELAGVASDRVNAVPSVVAERFAALRYALDRVDEVVCDGYATAATPDVPADTPVETKAVRVAHQCREGRFSVHAASHAQLLEADGVYAIVVYGAVDVGGDERVLVLDSALVDAAVVDREVPTDGRCDYQKVRWSLVLEADVDWRRWSG